MYPESKLDEGQRSKEDSHRELFKLRTMPCFIF